MKKIMGNFFPPKYAINRYRIGIGRYEKKIIGNLSDRPILKMAFIGVYWYRPIWKKAYRSYPGPKSFGRLEFLFMHWTKLFPKN